MTTETPERKKPREKDPITKEEWRANQATVKAVRDEDSEDLRQMLKNKIAGIVGRHPNPLHHSIKMAAHLIDLDFLLKPEWHAKSTLTLEHFGTEELAEAYTQMKSGDITPAGDDDSDPF